MCAFGHHLSKLGRSVVDFALPPRCVACGTIVAGEGSLCPDCWSKAQFLTGPACSQCGRPLPDSLTATGDIIRCGACLASPPDFDGMRAVMAYDDIASTVAIQLKHGRHIAHARTMAGLMARLLTQGKEGADVTLVPVPLHRWRLWRRGFNQSALIALHLSDMTGIPHDPFLLRRNKSTPSLGHLNRTQRRKAVAGAFEASREVAGRHVLLIDDVFTTGATAQGCAKALKKAGATRVDLVCWARVCTDLVG